MSGHVSRYAQSDSAGQHWYSADANWRVLVGGTDCRHLVNTIELSVCDGYAALAALCQITSPDGVAPIRMVNVSASVSLPLHHKVQKFFSGTGSPGWSRKKGRKTVVV